jgi:hypothetical protein
VEREGRKKEKKEADVHVTWRTVTPSPFVRSLCPSFLPGQHECTDLPGTPNIYLSRHRDASRAPLPNPNSNSTLCSPLSLLISLFHLHHITSARLLLFSNEEQIDDDMLPACLYCTTNTLLTSSPPVQSVPQCFPFCPLPTQSIL